MYMYVYLCLYLYYFFDYKLLCPDDYYIIWELL